MGQRHQFWLVARVANRHRVLAAVHHQWAYGTIPIKACWRLLQMMKNPHNQTLAKHELAGAALLDDAWWKKQREVVFKQQDLDAAVPFPFLLTCLVLATSFDPRPNPAINYSTRVHPLAIGTSLDETDNNDGFTVVDITDLDNPAYCFLHDDKDNKPITAEAYLTCYGSSRSNYRPSLDSWPLIRAETLRDIWPDVQWLDKQASSSVTTTTDGQSKVLGPETEVAKPSLWEMAFRKAVDAVLNDAESEKVLDSVHDMPGFADRLLQYLIDNAKMAQLPGGALLLRRAFAGQKFGASCDLSPWANLTDDDILHIFKHAASLDDVTTIDISNNPNTIVAMNTPALSLADVLRSLHDCGKKCQVWHTERFKAPFAISDNVKTKPTVASLTQRPATDDTIWSSSPYVAGLKTVSQVLFYFYMGNSEADREEGIDRRNASNLPWPKAIEELKTLLGGLRFSGYGQPGVRCIPVHDAMLDTSQAAEWFPQIMQTVLHKSDIIDRIHCSTMCSDLSMALAVGLKDAWRVFPLPANAYMCTDIGNGCRAIPQCCPVDDQSWTMLVFHGTLLGDGRELPAIGTAYYSFVTRGPDGNLVVADLEHFAKLTSGDGGVDPAVDDLITKMKAADVAEKEGSSARPITVEELENNVLSVDWAKLKAFHEEEAKEIVDKFIPAFEMARKQGFREDF